MYIGSDPKPELEPEPEVTRDEDPTGIRRGTEVHLDRVFWIGFGSDLGVRYFAQA